MNDSNLQTEPLALADLRTHRESEGYPAFNCKVHRGPTPEEFAEALAEAGIPEGATVGGRTFEEWAEDPRNGDNARELAGARAWEDFEEFAREVFGRDAQAGQCGRSGGWVYVKGGTARRLEDLLDLRPRAERAAELRAEADKPLHAYEAEYLRLGAAELERAPGDPEEAVELAVQDDVRAFALVKALRDYGRLADYVANAVAHYPQAELYVLADDFLAAYEAEQHDEALKLAECTLRAAAGHMAEAVLNDSYPTRADAEAVRDALKLLAPRSVRVVQPSDARGPILEAIARTLAISAVADAYEDSRADPEDEDEFGERYTPAERAALEAARAGAGEDWDDTVPEGWPAEAMVKAHEIVRSLEELNPGRSLEDIAAEWCRQSGQDSARFAHCLALEALGHGVGLDDDLPPYAYDRWHTPRPKVPRAEFSSFDFDLAAFLDCREGL